MTKEKTLDATVYSILFALCFAHFLNDMMQSVIPAIYPMLKDKYSLTFGQIGTITLVYQMTASILQPFVGGYADRHPLPFSLAIGMAFIFCGILLTATANTFGWILLAVAVVGLGSAVFHPEASRIAQMAAGTKKGLAQSIFQVGGNGGSALGPVLAALLILPFGQSATAWLAIAALIGAVLLYRVGLWYKRRLHLVEAKIKQANELVKSLSQRRINCAFALLIVLIFSKYFFMSCMTSYFTFFLIERFDIGIDESQYCLFGFLAAIAVGTLIGGELGDKYGRKYVIWGSIFGAAPFAIAMPYANFFWTVVLSIIVGFVIASAFSAIVVYATELKPGKVGEVAGIFFGLMFGLGGIGSAFFGWLADRTSIEFIFQVSTLLPLLGIVAAFLPDIEKPMRK